MEKRDADKDGKASVIAKTVLAALALFGRALSVSASNPVEWTGTYSFFSDNKPSFPGTLLHARV